jgi:hypothetical protein
MGLLVLRYPRGHVMLRCEVAPNAPVTYSNCMERKFCRVKFRLFSFEAHDSCKTHATQAQTQKEPNYSTS